jgi:pimeloyl-ACP methyl ester carboxylesterase
LGDHVPPLVVLGGRAVWAGDVQEGFGEALDEADLFFQAEMPAVQGWSFGPADAAGVTQPVLNVLGARSVPRFVEGSELIRSWFPQAERLSVPDAGHMLMLQNAAGLADGLRDFLRRPALVGRSRDPWHRRSQRSERAKWNELIVRPSRM